MARLNFKAMAEDINDPRMEKFLEFIGKTAPDVSSLKNVAINERPFLPELAWAYFAAYTSILYGSLLRYNILKTGVSNADKYWKTELAQKILKAALPHQSAFIESQEPEAYFYLLEEVEEKLLFELRKILEGREADKAATSRAKEIMDAVNSVEIERAQEIAIA